MIALVKKFLADENGLEMVEYAVVGALIVVAGVVGLSLVGSKIAALWPQITGAMP